MNHENQCAAQAQSTISNPNRAGYADTGACLGEANMGNQKRLIGFGFGEALQRVKDGRRMSRHGWNGAGQFVYVVVGSDQSHPDERAGLLSGIRSSLFAFGDRGTVRRLPHVALCNTRGESVPWAPSQSDMLAEDWFTV